MRALLSLLSLSLLLACSGLPPATDDGETGELSSALGAPDGLLAFVGGPSVAIRWNPVPDAVRYEIFRDGVSVGVVTPGFHSEFPEKNGNGFLDKTLAPGATVTYAVRAFGANNAPSAFSAELKVPHPAVAIPVPVITLDTTQAPDLDGWLRFTAKPFLEQWYPKIVNALAQGLYQPTMAFSIRIDPNYNGVAYASGSQIVVSANFARNAPQDMGMFLHESTHVLEAFNFGNVPGWITEGIADWTREFMLHDRDPVVPTAGDYYESGYSEGSYFLNWMQARYQPGLIRALNATAHAGRYRSDTLTAITGKSIDATWSEMTGHPIPAPIRFTALADRCLDGSGDVTSKKCNGGLGQRFGVVDHGGGLLTIHRGRRCLDVQWGKTASGTPVWLYECIGSAAQQWRLLPGGLLQNPISGRCLDVQNANPADGVPLQIWDCNGTAAQTLTLP